MSFRAPLAALALALGALTFPSASQATPPARERVLQLLNAYESTSTTAEWTALGPETPAVLIGVYDDTRQMPYVRMRAVAAVANFPTEATHEFLRRVATQPGQGELFIREAVMGIARAFGTAAEGEVSGYLVHTSATVRSGAVRALAGLHTVTAQQALQARLGQERDAGVRDAITRALAR